MGVTVMCDILPQQPSDMATQHCKQQRRRRQRPQARARCLRLNSFCTHQAQQLPRQTAYPEHEPCLVLRTKVWCASMQHGGHRIRQCLP